MTLPTTTPNVPALVEDSLRAQAITLHARLACLRMLRDVQGKEDGAAIRATLTQALLLPPADNVPATTLSSLLAANTDALFGCGDAQVVACCNALMPLGSPTIAPPALLVIDALPAITPAIVDAASAYDRQALLSILVQATCDNPAWTDFWRNALAEENLPFLELSAWVAGWATAPVEDHNHAAARIAVLAAYLGHPGIARFNLRLGLDKADNLAWMEHAALLRLINPQASEAVFKPLAKATAMRETGNLPQANAAFAARVLHAHDTGAAPWGLDAQAFLLTPAPERRRALLALGRLAPPAASLPTSPAMKARPKALKAFIDEPKEGVTVAMFEAIAKRYAQAVDHTLATTNPAQRTAGLEEAATMRGLLQRPFATPSHDHLHTAARSLYNAALTTGAMVFVDYARASLTSATLHEEQTNAWVYAKHSVAFGSEPNLTDCARRCDASFAAWLAKSLNLVSGWTFLVLVQHKPEVFASALAATRVGDLLVRDDLRPGTSYYQTALSNTHALWALCNPRQRLDVYARLEQENGFAGRPGLDHDHDQVRALPHDAYLLATVAYARRKGTTFADAGRDVPAGFLVHDLITAGTGESFLAAFPTVDRYLALDHQTIVEQARSWVRAGSGLGAPS